MLSPNCKPMSVVYGIYALCVCNADVFDQHCRHEIGASLDSSQACQMSVCALHAGHLPNNLFVNDSESSFCLNIIILIILLIILLIMQSFSNEIRSFVGGMVIQWHVLVWRSQCGMRTLSSSLASPHFINEVIVVL